jgi:hypothetical protein
MLKNLYLLIFSLKIFKKIQYRLFVNVEKVKNLNILFVFMEKFELQTLKSLKTIFVQTQGSNFEAEPMRTHFCPYKKTQVLDWLKFVSNLLTNACSLQTKLYFNIEKKSYIQMSVSYGRNF